MKIDQVTVVPTPEEYKILPIDDHTKMSAINTCPKWGLIRYGKHLAMPGAGRAMALEAGEASHDGFAAVRLYQLLHYSDHPKRKELFERVGVEEFGEDRLARMSKVLDNSATERTNLINFTLESLYSGNFFDDPSDKSRTVSNISESLIVYCDRWDMEKYPVWYSDKTADAKVGIEVRFDLMITIVAEIHGWEHKAIQSRYCGKIDGLHWNDKGNVIVHENKTGARIDDAWLAQWQLSHQITGYCIACSTMLEVEALQAHVIGMRIPVGRDLGAAVRKETVNRTPEMINDFFRWLTFTKLLAEEHEQDVVSAPMFTHSCNRYFRPCSFVPLCTAPPEEQRDILEEMEVQKWSPLETKVVG